MSFFSDFFALATQMVVFAFVGRLVAADRLPSFNGTETTYVEFVAIGLVVNLFVQIALTRTATAIRTEQMIGTLEALLMTPTATATVQLGSAVFDLVYVPIRTAIFLGFLALVVGLDLHASGILPSAVILLAFIPFVWGLGLATAGAILTFRRGDGGMMIGVTLLGLASGAFFPLALLPAWIASVAEYNPLAIAIQGMREALLGGTGWSEVGGHVALLVPMSIALPAGWRVRFQARAGPRATPRNAGALLTARTDIDAVFGRLDELLDSAPSLHDLEHHRLLLVAARRRRALGLEVPGRMVAAERMAAAGAMAAPVLMAKVRAALDGPMLLIKGAEVAQHYPDPALRSYGDLDLLVPDAERSQRQLLDAGFELCGEAWVYEGIHHLRPLRAPGLPLLVELHHEPKWIDRLEPPARSRAPRARRAGPAPVRRRSRAAPGTARPRDGGPHLGPLPPDAPARPARHRARRAHGRPRRARASGGGLGPRARLANHLAGHGLPVRRRRRDPAPCASGPAISRRSASARCWSRTSSAGWPASGHSHAATLSAASEPPWPTT